MDYYAFLYDRDAFGRYWGYIRELELELEAPNFDALSTLAVLAIQQATGENDPKLVYINIGTPLS